MPVDQPPSNPQASEPSALTGQDPAAPPSPVQPTPTSLPPPRTAGVGTRVAAGIVAFLVSAGVAFYFTSDRSEPPTEEQVTAAFAPIEGYTYGEVPEGALQQARDVIASKPETKDEIVVFDARTLNVGTQPIGAVLIMGVDSSLSSGEREDFLKGFEASAGSDMSEVQIGSETGYEGTTGLGSTVVFFDEDGMIFVLQGGAATSADVLKGIATELQKANAD